MTKSSGSKLAGTFRTFFRKHKEFSVKSAAGTFRTIKEQMVRQSALPHKMRPNAAVPVYDALCIRVSERQGRTRVLQHIMKYANMQFNVSNYLISQEVTLIIHKLLIGGCHFPGYTRRPRCTIMY